MMYTAQPHQTLIGALWSPQDGTRATNALLRGTILAVLGTVLLTVAAKIQVPLWPVPVTMGTFAVLTLSMAYGPRLAAATLLLYMAEGAMGLPVFAGTPEKGIGIAYMMGGTGGYLVGYVLAAVTVGWLAEKGWDRTVLGTASAMAIGTVLIFAPGLLWLGALFGWDKPILAWGLTPFLLGAVLKLALSTMVLPLAWKILGKRSARKDSAA